MTKAVSASELTTAEKATLLVGEDYWTLNGIPRLSIKGIRVSDGPNGLRRQLSDNDNLGVARSEPAICFPTESCAACSFDVELIESMGAALAAEARSQGVDVVLGPGVNMKRSPLAGRNFEYFSEDPFLSGKLGAAYIRGLQDNGIGCSLKHFVANNQETDRLISDSVIDDIALQELYLEAFRICVKESSPQIIMPAYNLLNGTYCCENEELLTAIARKEWGFKGVFVSDWGAENSNSASLPAGLDIVMPGPRTDYSDDVIKLVDEGKIEQSVLDDTANRITDLLLLHQHADEEACPELMPLDERLDVALRIAEESAVLLENDGVLPIDVSQSICVVGSFAVEPRYQGAGSSKINPCKMTDLLGSLHDMGVHPKYCKGYDPITAVSTDAQIEEAVSTAAACDVSIVVIGLPEGSESEGADRKDMKLPESHVRLVDAVCEANSNTCVIVQCGAPVELDFKKKPPALLIAYLGGCMGGLALANLVIGKCSPSGKLAETWPLALADTPCENFFPAVGHQALCMESIFNGYRYYDAANVEVAYPFGYGLTFTSFEYDDLQIDQRKDGSYDIRCRIKNVGSSKGAEIVQLYIASPSGAEYLHAPKRLVGFSKISLDAGEEGIVSFEIDEEAFRHWDPLEGRWAVVPGDYSLHVGSSSQDLLLSAMVRITDGQSSRYVVPAAYRSISSQSFTPANFKELYGREFPPIPSTKRPFTQNSTIGDIRSSISGAILLKAIIVGAKFLVRRDSKSKRLLDSLESSTPLRMLSMSGVDMRVIDGAVEILNLHIIKGLKLIKNGLGSLMGKVSHDPS